MTQGAGAIGPSLFNSSSLSSNTMKKDRFHVIFLLSLAAAVTITVSFAAESEPPASPEVTAAMRPYLDSYKLAGV